MRRHAIFTLVFVWLTTCLGPTGFARLIDDFSVDQGVVTTDHFAIFDQLVHPSLLGGDRWIWGGGAYACAECEISAAVAGGRFFISPGDRYTGAMAVDWGRGNFDLNLDIVGDTAIQLNIAELTGIAWTRISIYSGGNREVSSSRDVLLQSTGPFAIPFSTFSSPIALQSVDRIVISTFLDVSEFIAFDSVSTVPEPFAMAYIAVAFIAITSFRRQLPRTVNARR